MKRIFIVDAIKHVEPASVLESRNQFSRMSPSIHIEDNRRDIFNLRIDCVAENDRLHDGYDEHEEQRAWLSSNVVTLFDQDRPKACHGFAVGFGL